MAHWYEGRAPQGAPSDGDRDIMFDEGKVKYVQYSTASGWVVVRTLDWVGTPTSGTDADTVDTKHASDFSASDHNHSGSYSEVMHGSLTVSTADPSGGVDGDFWFKREA